MTRKILGVAVAGMALGLIASACDVEQPDPGCRVPHGFTNEYIVRLTPKAGQTPTGACADKKWERMGIDEYLPPDSTDAKMAITPRSVGIENYFEESDRSDQRLPAKEGKPASVGQYMTEVPESGICTATNFEPTSWTFPAVPDETLPDGGVIPGSPEETISFDFDNVQIYSTAEIPGTQGIMDVTYTGTDGCTAEYDGIGVYPPVNCANLDDEPDDRLCDIATEPTAEEKENGVVPGCRVLIPGILNECLNPSFVMKCDPERAGTTRSGGAIFYCVPTEFGALK